MRDAMTKQTKIVQLHTHRTVKRDEARQSLAWMAERVTDRPDQSDDSQRYRGRRGWPAGSLDHDIYTVLEYFALLNRQETKS